MDWGPLDELKGEKYFIKIDLKSGYDQVAIKPSDVWNTSLKSKEVIFKMLVMPFWLMNHPPSFIRLMDYILCPFTNSFVTVYLDNMLMFNQSYKERLHHIQ